MLDRYTTPEMKKIFSEERKFFYWLLTEIAVLKVRYRIGELKESVPENLIEKIGIDPKEINRIEKEVTKHDVVAFLSYVSPQFPEGLRPWLHKGLTSYDIGDTSLSLQMRESIVQLSKTISKLMEVVKKIAEKYKYTPEIGRTHGIHAEPISFGVKLANWYDELKRHARRLKHLKETISVGKISGAVGMYTLDPKIEEMVCEELELQPIIATQIVSRDIVAEYMTTLGIICASIGKFALNIRLLSQTEIGEVMESFSKNQKGSSAMPHKQNPISSENICSLMRTACSYVPTAYENLANCWHERSLDNSGSERVLIPDIASLLDFSMNRLTGVLENMGAFPEIMMDNLNFTKGLIFSQEVMMLVASKSPNREIAHTLVRDIALECKKNHTDFLQALLAHTEIKKMGIDEKELSECFNLDSKLRHIDYIFKKVFNND